ncbi:uncharacterized protein LOC135935905 isoform X2 [Cloeon dipterum]|uniref:uncharacterized protein LOC135935905 isoform X2 n=1 Tax=Cloeon dipterum TaxID=197152 RepID=UPI00321FFFA3
MADIQTLWTLFSKMMQIRKNCGYRIQAIAKKFGILLSPNFGIENLLDLPADQLMKVLNDLLSMECNKLLRYEEEMDILMVPALEISLRMGLKSVDLTAFLSYCPIELQYQYFKSAVVRMFEIAPNIEELIMTSKKNRIDRDPGIAVDTELLQALGRLVQLKHLQIDDLCYFDGLDDIFQLGERLQELQFLSVCFPNGFADIDFEEHQTAEKLKKSFPNLKVFIYNASAEYHLRRLCMDHMPNLQVIETYANKLCSKHDYNSVAHLDPERRGTSNLRHLLVDFSQEESTSESMHLEFPHVSHLWIFWFEEGNCDEIQWQNLLKFTHIESLEMSCFPLPAMNCFLDTYGPNLLALSIIQEYKDESSLTFQRIFTACPKLEKLKLRTTIIYPEPITFFSHLEEVELSYWCASEELTNILSAPHLQKVTLYGDYFSVKDIKMLKSSVIEKKVLRKLKTLIIQMGIPSWGRLTDVEHFKEIMELIKCAAVSTLLWQEV